MSIRSEATRLSQEQGNFSITDLVERLSLSRNSISSKVSKLVRKGEFVAEGGGYYRAFQRDGV